jgi:hypothetical protein
MKSMNRIIIRALTALSGAIILAALTACGGGDTGSTSSDGGNTQVASGTIIGFGSVIVNGIEFSRKPGLTDDRVKLSFENITSASENKLRIGMTVTIKGTINNAAGTGEYESIEFQPELRGPLDVGGIDTSANTLTVMGRKVQVTGNTSFDSGISSLSDINQAGNNPELEISGNLDTSTGVLNATRIARKALDFNVLADKNVQIKGKIASSSVVSGANSGSFTIGSTTINFSAAALGPNTTGVDLATGTVAEVKGVLNGSVITASRIEKKTAVDAGVNDNVKLKGTANGSIVNNTFTINGPNGAITVNTAAASFQKGSAAATAAIVTLGTTLEVEGVLRADGSVAATKVNLEVEKTFMVEGNAVAGAYNPATKTLTLNGVPVIISASTRLLDKDALALDPVNIAAGDHLQVSGVIDSATGKVNASQVQRTKGSNLTFIQGPVTAIDATAKTLTLIGIIKVTIDTTTAAFDNRTGTKTPITTPFPFSITTDGFTVVKVKGTVTGTTLSASELEFEQTQ